MALTMEEAQELAALAQEVGNAEALAVAQKAMADLQGGGADYIGEPALAMGDAAARAILGGTSGMIAGGIEAGKRALGTSENEAPISSVMGDVAREMQAGGFQPRTQAGQEGMQDLAAVVEPVVDLAGKAVGGVSALGHLATGQGLKDAAAQPGEVKEKGIGKYIGDLVYDATGSPGLATAAQTAPTALAEMAGLWAVRGLRPGVQLLSADGSPTRAMRRSLDRVGLVYENLMPEVKSIIPARAPNTGVLARPDVSSTAYKALYEQIKAGGTDDVIADLRIEGGRIVPDIDGKQAINNGWPSSTVADVKAQTPETQAGLTKMLRQARAISKNGALASKFRPSDVAGESAMKRFDFVRGKAKEAARELDDIAKNRLAGVPVDTKIVLDALREQLERVKVGADFDSGMPSPDFSRSLIELDPSSQKVINDVIEILSKGTPDALRAHDLKRIIDAKIDYSRTTEGGGLSATGQRVLKSVRKALNDSVRNVDNDYARVNDVLSKSLTAMDDLDDAMGTLDIGMKNAASAVGTRMRGILSNNQNRIPISNAIDNLNAAAKDLGAEFADDPVALMRFANSIDARFDAIAKTSLQGQTEQAIRNVAREGAIKTAADKGFAYAGGAIDRLRGISDFEAFETMEKLLTRNQGAK